MGSLKRVCTLGGAWILLLGSNCGTSEGGSEGTCKELYGNVAGYDLCEETEDSCIFYRNDQSGDGISCAAICATRAALCRAAWMEGDADVCAVSKDPDLDCMEIAHDSVCECGAARLGDLGDDCISNAGCDPEASPLGAFCCLDAEKCGPNLNQCVEDCSSYSSGGEVGMVEDALCQDNSECGAGLFCCLVPDAEGNCDFSKDQSCTCRTIP